MDGSNPSYPFLLRLARASILLGFGLYLASALAGAAIAAEVCDLQRLSDADKARTADKSSGQTDTSLRYHRAGDYCEGSDPQFVSNPVGAPLELVGVTAGPITFSPTGTTGVVIQAAFPRKEKVAVQLRSAPDFDTYRLDGATSSKVPLKWIPATVFGKTGFEVDDLAMLGTVLTSNGPIAIPLSIDTIANPTELVLTIKPHVDLSNLKWQWTPFVSGLCLEADGPPTPINGTAALSRAARTITAPIASTPYACLSVSGLDSNSIIVTGDPFIIQTGPDAAATP